MTQTLSWKRATFVLATVGLDPLLMLLLKLCPTTIALAPRLARIRSISAWADPSLLVARPRNQSGPSGS